MLVLAGDAKGDDDSKDRSEVDKNESFGDLTEQLRAE